MARRKERIFAGFFAVLFLLTSSAFTILVIVSNASSGKSSNSTSKSSTSSNTSTATKTPATATTPTTTPATSTSTMDDNSKSQVAGDTLENFTPTTTPQAKLEYSDTVVGTGATVAAGDTISANYVGALMSNGKIFDASISHGGAQTFSLSQVIEGWGQAIPGMKVGGTRRLLIPSSLGYGAQGSGSTIPPNSDLVFDVTVTAIGK
jgi:FKBP-type peptidyl-prolyl cis-trans isomerase